MGNNQGNRRTESDKGREGDRGSKDRHGEKSGGGDGVAQRMKCEQQTVWRAEGVERLNN